MLHTTFALAHQANACTDAYRSVGKSLGGIRAYGRNTPIPLTRILELRGLQDALWCLRCVLPEEEAQRDRLARLLACDFAEHVAPLWVAPPGKTWKPADTIEVARRYAVGQAAPEELDAARAAAWAAARAAAWDAAWAAAWDAAWAAAGAAERAWQETKIRDILKEV